MEIASFCDDPQQHLTSEQRRWLSPPSRGAEMAATCGWSLNRLLVKTAFRVKIEGLGNLPSQPPYLLTPNHSSSLDPPLLAAALPNRVLHNTYWIARRGAVMRSVVTRRLSRWGHAIPFDRRRDGMSALAAAAFLLQQGRNVVWFPEGRRTDDGSLQPFKFGVGALLDQFEIPAVPIHIRGAFDALPPGTRWPRLRAKLVIRFGEPYRAPRGDSTEEDVDRYQLLADHLREAVAALAV
ncbi:MAG: lysophospholipid acyltransferase family protein [Pirellulaceae bacterium]